MVYLSDFHILRPQFEMEQKAILEWLAMAHAYAEKSNKQFAELIQKKLFKIGLGEDKIKKRGLSLPDIGHSVWKEMMIYNLDKAPYGSGFKERMIFFDKVVTQLFETFYPTETPLPCHLIHVTCTGYMAPSGAQKIVSSRGGKTEITHAYHMGCCAAMAGLRMAKGFLNDSSKVDIVHTELCSLHMNPLAHENEQLVVQSLFGDGYIKYSITSEKKGLALLSLHEEIIPNSLEAIEWGCCEWGLSMNLAQEVPSLILRELPSFLKSLTNKAGLDLTKILNEGFFAIHPGGSKIIKEISRLLKLKPWQVEHSWYIMQNYGNMSSATQPHIWEKMEKDPQIPKGATIVSFAFGPGLTISGGVFEKCGG